MKNLFFLLTTLVLLGITSCMPDSNAIPEDLEGKKQFVIQKNEEIRALEMLVKEVSQEINKIEPKEKRLTPVEVMSIQREDFKRFVDLQGSVMSSEVVFASGELGGRVKKIYKEEGDYIRKGEVLAIIDLESITKQAEEITKSLELANDVFTRQENLWNQNIGSEVQYLQAKNNKERLEKTLETLEYQLSKSSIVAPITGYIENLMTQEGEVSSPGMPIAQIINTQDVVIVADVPESYIGIIEKGDPVVVKFPSLKTETQAKVSLIGRTIDASNRTFKVEIDLKNKNGNLKPNLLAIVQINDLTIENVISVPIELVQQEVSGRNYIMIVDGSGEKLASKKVFVETGESAKGNVVITAGLSGDEKLISNGARGLASGELIVINDDNQE
jgi:RND family efflux transporter MFP subunit